MVCPSLLSAAIPRLEEVELVCVRPGLSQLNAIFRSLEETEELKLRYFNISDNDLSMVDPRILSAVICKLHQIDLLFVNLTEQQWASIFRALSGSQRAKLSKLDVGNRVDFSRLQSPALAAASVQLRELTVRNTALPPELCQQIFNKISQADTSALRLRYLNIRENSIR